MMNDSYERSYYEIALTNSQVFSALAILLLCLLSSFVAGMWVAREAGGPAPMRVTQTALEEKPVSGEPGDAEFRFFRRLGDGASESSGTGAEAASKTEPVTRAGAPAQQGSGRQRATSDNTRGQGVARTVSPIEVADRPERKPAVEQASAPLADKPTSEPQRPIPQPSTSQERSTSQPALPKPALQNSAPQQTADVAQAQAQSTKAAVAVVTPPDPTPTKIPDDEPKMGQMMVVQVLSSADQKKAGEVVMQLKGSGYRAFLSPALVEGRTMYRVRVGPYSDRASAEQASEKIKNQFRLDTWVTARG